MGRRKERGRVSRRREGEKGRVVYWERRAREGVAESTPVFVPPACQRNRLSVVNSINNIEGGGKEKGAKIGE